MILSCARKIPFLDRKVRERIWDFTIAKPLFRTQYKTLGLFGFGKIARMVAKKALGFGFKVLAHDPYVSKGVRDIEMVPFKQILSDSDFLSIHVPLTEETRHFFGEDEFKSMKKTAFLVNTSRGPIVDEKALYKALKEEWIAGAALDVMEEEPPDWEDPLLTLNNVILTPHISFYSEESYKELKTKVSEAVLAVLKGKPPRSVVNPQVLQD